MHITMLFDKLWQSYSELNPEVQKIYQLFVSKNGDQAVINDHIALRTFNLPGVDIQCLAQPFVDRGYYYAGDYTFAAKKLRAKHLQHDDTSLPKVFISELFVEQLSKEAQAIIHKLYQQMDIDHAHRDDFCCSGIHWSLSYQDYCQLLKESEYAAWMSAFGYRPNHFTVLVNALTSHRSLEEVNQWLLDQGYRLNDSGGLIKGSPSVYLEQSSTLAATANVKFTDCTMEIPSCFYEFAYRYPLADGNLYQGFVTSSADKIFESTDASS